jgi:hypothetical protein
MNSNDAKPFLGKLVTIKLPNKSYNGLANRIEKEIFLEVVVIDKTHNTSKTDPLLLPLQEIECIEFLLESEGEYPSNTSKYEYK